LQFTNKEIITHTETTKKIKTTFDDRMLFFPPKIALTDCFSYQLLPLPAVSPICPERTPNLEGSVSTLKNKQNPSLFIPVFSCYLNFLSFVTKKMESKRLERYS